jgi:hypothetical protein
MVVVGIKIEIEELTVQVSQFITMSILSMNFFWNAMD